MLILLTKKLNILKYVVTKFKCTGGTTPKKRLD